VRRSSEGGADIAAGPYRDQGPVKARAGPDDHHLAMMLHLDPAQADVAAWRALAQRASEPNPFFEPELLLPAVARLGDDGVRLLVARDAGGAWTGLLPIRRAAQWRRLPTSSQGTWMHRHCFLGAPLLAAGSEAEAMTALLDEVRSRASLVPLERLPADGPVADAVHGALEAAGIRAVVWDEHERAVLRRRPQEDYVESILSSKRRREHRRQRGHLEREIGGGLECDDASQDPAAVDAFLALEASGWKGRAGTAMGSAADDAFFRECCDGFRAAGRLQLLLLRAGDRVVAAKCNFVAGDGVFCFKIAYDEALARFSPGVQLELDNVHAFHARPELAWEDSCADATNQMINRLWPDRRRLMTLLVPGSGARGRVGRMQAGMAAGLRHRLKEHA